MAVFHFSLQFAAQGETHHVLATKFQPGEWAQILPRLKLAMHVSLALFSLTQIFSNRFQSLWFKFLTMHSLVLECFLPAIFQVSYCYLTIIMRLRRSKSLSVFAEPKANNCFTIIFRCEHQKV